MILARDCLQLDIQLSLMAEDSLIAMDTVLTLHPRRQALHLELRKMLVWLRFVFLIAMVQEQHQEWFRD